MPVANRAPPARVVRIRITSYNVCYTKLLRSSAADTNNRAVIRGNVVRNVGNVGIGVSSCIDCIIENNIVIQEQLAWSRAIAAPNRSTTPPRADNNATTLRNNTVWFGSNVTGEGYYVGERGSGYKVSNNIAYFTTFV